VEADVIEAARPAYSPPGLQKPNRPLDGHDRPGWPDDLAQVSGGVPRPGTDIEDARADRDPGPVPAVEGGRPPDPVFETQPRELLVVGAENVVALTCYRHSRTPLDVSLRQNAGPIGGPNDRSPASDYTRVALAPALRFLRSHRNGRTPGGSRWFGWDVSAGHDLAASVRAADPHCRYTRVTTVKVAGLLGGR
jgi:hypothetical protein